MHAARHADWRLSAELTTSPSLARLARSTSTIDVRQSPSESVRRRSIHANTCRLNLGSTTLLVRPWQGRGAFPQTGGGSDRVPPGQSCPVLERLIHTCMTLPPPQSRPRGHSFPPEAGQPRLATSTVRQPTSTMAILSSRTPSTVAPFVCFFAVLFFFTLWRHIDPGPFLPFGGGCTADSSSSRPLGTRELIERATRDKRENADLPKIVVLNLASRPGTSDHASMQDPCSDLS